MAHYACPHCSEPLDDADIGLPICPYCEGKTPLFTDRHHNAIIKVLHIALEGATTEKYDGMNSLKEDLGIMLANDNPEFDRHKFDDA